MSLNDHAKIEDAIEVGIERVSPLQVEDPHEQVLRAIAEHHNLPLDFVKGILPCYCLVAACRGEMQIDRVEVENGYVVYAGCGCGNEQRTPIPPR